MPWQSCRAGDGRYDVVTANLVGTVVSPRSGSLIRPKAGLRNTFFLLGYGAGLTRWSPPPFPFEVERDLLRAVAWVFEAEVRHALPRGVVRGYHPQEESGSPRCVAGSTSRLR